MQTGRVYDLTFAGTNPSTLRFHILTPTNALQRIGIDDDIAAMEGPSHCAVLRIFYANPQRLNVYRQYRGKTNFMEDMNFLDGKARCRLTQPDTCDTYETRYPTPSDIVGTNMYDMPTKTLWYAASIYLIE